MADHWDAGRKPDTAKLTPELRRKLIVEYAELIDRARLTADEVDVLVHILTHCGCGEDGSFFIPDFAVLWGGRPSYVPKMELEPSRIGAAITILRRRGVLRVIDTEPSLEELVQRAAAIIDRAVLEKLANPTK